MTGFLWFFRKWFWIVLAWFKAFANKPLVIPMPMDGSSGADSGAPLLVPVPLSQAIPGLPIDAVLACNSDDIPPDERSGSKTGFYKFQVWLYSAYPPMQAGLPSIRPDPDRALSEAYTWLHRTQYGPPTLPAEYLGSPDLGALAVRGPYACYTRRCADGLYEWDLQSLRDFEHHEGLVQLGARVLFEVDVTQRVLRAVAIDCALGRCTPGDSSWELAKRLALCSATTHLSLVRHFNWVHLASGAHLAIATRNRLPAAHALMRLLWPYVYATQQSNDTVTRGQMLRGGDFETTFSFNFEGMCQLFDRSYGECNFAMNDPVADARARQVLEQGFDTPTEQNLAALFGVMLDHAREYLALYYPVAAQGRSIEDLQSDTALKAWLDELNRLVPNGVGLRSDALSFEGLARLVASVIYMASAQHELLGSFMWNYQLWTHRQPIRVYANGQPEPMDVYQRLVNANFNLNVRRRALIGDFGYLALDPQGSACLQRFSARLEELQQTMAREPWAVWKLYPRVLKVNINA